MGNGGIAVARGLTYLDFDVLVERADHGAYRVRVVNAPAGPTPSIPFTVPFSQLELENFVLRIGRPRRVVRRVDEPETAAIKSFGSQLYRALFHDELEVNLLRSQSQAAAAGMGLRVRLRLSDTPELAGLPWEFLYDRARNRFVCLSDRTPLVRFLEVPDPPRPLPVSPPLRVLVMISSPHDPSFAELDVEQEWAKLHGVLGGLEQAGLVQLERLETATLGALRQQLRRADWHVLHFIGHGGFDPHAQDGVLVLEDQGGGSRLVTAQALGVPLHNHDPLRLVVLNACEGARADPTDPFAGTAQTLIQQGIPAVVAMQFEITDPAAIAFTSELYAAVADGYPLDAALSQARQAIYTDVSEVEWATPVLYLRAPDGHIFDVAPAPPAEERARAQAEREAAEREAAEWRKRAAAERETADQEAAERRAREREREAAEWRTREREAAEWRAREQEREAAEWRAREREARRRLARRRWRRWGVVALAAAVATGIFLGSRLNGPGAQHVPVPATQAWTDTHVDCEAGKVLAITATGAIYHNKNGGTPVGPGGDPNPSRRKANVSGLPHANHGALIGSIGRQQPYFVVGERTPYPCRGEGRLFLGINDHGVDNNAGQFSATISRK
jgi:CHAT domain